MINRLIRRRERGQSLAELGLLLPILLLIALITVDFGRAYFAYVSVTNAARNGAEYAASSSIAANDNDGIREAALADTSNLVNVSATNPAVTSTTGSDFQGRPYAEVTVVYEFSTMFNWPVVGGDFDIVRTVRMRVPE